jgi:hypothetical protein
VELRFFAGMSVEETAGVMGISTATVKREWSSAKAWLNREIAGGKVRDLIRYGTVGNLGNFPEEPVVQGQPAVAAWDGYTWPLATTTSSAAGPRSNSSGRSRPANIPCSVSRTSGRRSPFSTIGVTLTGRSPQPRKTG